MAGLGGSFSPVHRAHVNMMLKMKEICEELFEGDLVMAYFVAALDGHVQRKTKSQAMKGKHRVQLCRLAAEGYNYITTPETLYPMSKLCLVEEASQFENAVHIQMLGGDYSFVVSRNVCSRIHDCNDLTVLFARSPDTDNFARDAVKAPMKDVYWLSAGTLFVDFDFDISSTLIREELRIAHGLDKRADKEAHVKKLWEKDLLPKSVCDYILDNEKEIYF